MIKTGRFQGLRSWLFVQLSHSKGNYNLKLMQTILTGPQTFVDYLQTLHLYKGSVGTNDALLGQICTAGSSIY